MSCKVRRIVLILLSILALFVQGLSSTYGYWEDFVLDSGRWLGKYSSIVVDQQNYPHIVYYDGWYHDLKHAYQDIGGWHIDWVERTGEVGLYPSLEIDQNNILHVSYYDLLNKDLRYAKQTSEGWAYETVDSYGDVGQYTCLKIDSRGFPHISYYDKWNQAINYAYKNEEGWNTEIMFEFDFPYWVFRYSCLDLDNEDLPHVILNNVSDYYELLYVYKDQTGWQTEFIENPEEGHNHSKYPSICIDGDNQVHVAYGRNYGTRYLVHAVKSEAGWTYETISFSHTYMFDHVSLKIDSNNTCHVSYYEFGLKYAYKDDSGWHIDVLHGDTGYYGLYNSLAIDSNGYAHICYYNEPPYPEINQNLMYITNSLPTPTPTPTQTPTSTPTSTPIATNTPIPTPWVGVNLILPGSPFSSGDWFRLRAQCRGNPDDTEADLYVVLDVYGEYWFWPKWTQEPQSELIQLFEDRPNTIFILDFQWPEGDFGSAEGLVFWGAILDPGTSSVIGNIDNVGFGWRY